MTAILPIIIVIFIAVAIWQMVKIFDLAQVGTADYTQVANDKDNRINGYLMLGFLGFIYLITIISFAKWGDLPLVSNSASEHGPGLDNLMIISMVVIFFVQTVTQFLLHWFAYKYKGQRGRKALFYADNNTLEAIWTIIPVIVLAGLIIYGLFTWTSIMNIDEEDDPMIIELYAQQFNWTARYAGADNTLGMANVRLIDIDKANVLGVDEADPNAQDDVVTKELHLIVDRPVLFKMRSQDVLHSAYMPHFRAQMNCVPGMITQFGFTPTVTTEEMRDNPDIIDKVTRINELRVKNRKEIEARGQDVRYQFDYLLLCNKICGKSHYNMQMKIIVETQEEFEEWIATQQDFGSAMATVDESETTDAATETENDTDSESGNETEMETRANETATLETENDTE